MAARLQNILSFVRSLPKSVGFYRDGLGLRMVGESETSAEFEAGPSTLFTLQVPDTITRYLRTIYAVLWLLTLLWTKRGTVCARLLSVY